MKTPVPTSSAFDRLLKLAESATASAERHAIMITAQKLINEESRQRKIAEATEIKKKKSADVEEWAAFIAV